jgi:hypothetical protein
MCSKAWIDKNSICCLLIIFGKNKNGKQIKKRKITFNFININYSICGVEWK